MERYEEYKDSGVDWIGEIPAGWEVRRAKTIFTLRKTKGNKSLVQLAATQDQGMIPQSMLDSVVKIAQDSDLSQFRTVHKGDFVISLRSFQGGFELSRYEGVCSPAYQVFCGDNSLRSEYCKYLFKSDAFISKMNSLTVGIREGKNIQYQDFANLLLAFPKQEDQQVIADYLDIETYKIDSLVEDCEREVELLQEYRKAVISEAVTKGLDPNAPMKDSGIDWIGKTPEGWQVAQLGRLCETRNGLDYDATQVCGASDEGSVLVIRSGNVSSGQLVLDDCLYIRKEVPDQLLLRKGDVVIVRTNGSKELVGKSALVKTDGVGTLGAFMLLCRSRFGRYINWLLQSTMLTYYMGAFSTSTVNQLSNGVLRRLHVPFPAEAVQEEICNYLDAKTAEIDSLIADYQSMADKLREYRTSLISEAVTGKFKVPGVA